MLSIATAKAGLSLAEIGDLLIKPLLIVRTVSRDPMSYPYDRRNTGANPGSKTIRARLNDYFVEGRGINNEVLHREITKYLGPEASARSTHRNV